MTLLNIAGFVVPTIGLLMMGEGIGQLLGEVFEGIGVGGDTVDYLLRRHTYSIAKARRVLGYEPTVGLDEGMARCEAWLREVGLLG